MSRIYLLKIPSLLFVFMSLAMSISLAVYAEDANEVEEAGGRSSTAIYVPLSPPFVINYGGVGRLKYIKTEISVRTADSATASAIKHNMPLIRNAIVMLISRQSEEDIDSQLGIESLREEAKNEMISLLKLEQSACEVTEVFFNSFIVQK